MICYVVGMYVKRRQHSGCDILLNLMANPGSVDSYVLVLPKTIQ